MSEFRNTTDERFTRWRKSPVSGGSDGCLYVSRADDGSGLVALAESNDGAEGGILVLDPRSWDAFVAGAKGGAFDVI